MFVLKYIYVFTRCLFNALGSPNHQPQELLPIEGDTYEEQVISIIKNVVEPSGFSVISWSRVPYFCEGDLAQSYYWLDDLLLLLKIT